MYMNLSPQLPENLEGCCKSQNELLPSSSPRSFPFSNIFLRGLFENWKVKVKSLSRVRLFGTPRTVAYQAPQSVEFSIWKQTYNLSCGKLPLAESEGSNSVYLLPRPFWNYSPSDYHQPNNGREGILLCLDIGVGPSKVYGKITDTHGSRIN